ncbi:MAG TPA: DUF2231 domain-containing protein [Nitrospiraceae bacterium]|nr:DUF2231 domain-containing protein [Nitrospiraceae bacterium]
MEQQPAMVRHPIHLMLMPFPIALWSFSLASDAMYWLGFGGPMWQDIALYSMVAGIGGGVAAAIPAYFDYRAIRDPDLAHVAKRHMWFNGHIVLLYSLNAALRFEASPEAWVPAAASVTGACMLMVSAWWTSQFTYAEAPAVDVSWERAA